MFAFFTKSAARPLLVLAVSAVWTIASFGALTMPTQASANSVFYRAQLAQPVAERTQQVVSGVIWLCEGTQCIGTKGRSRATIECQRLVGEVGPVASFSADKKPLDAAELERCNA